MRVESLVILSITKHGSFPYLGRKSNDDCRKLQQHNHKKHTTILYKIFIKACE